MAVGDAAWQGGIQYINNILNALNVAGRSRPLEVHLFKHSAQHFPDLEKFKQIKVVIHDTEKVYGPWSFSNRLKWFAQRKLAGRINPRIENVLQRIGVDYVFPSTLSDCNKKLNVGSWIADFQYHHFPVGANASITSSAHKTISTIAAKANKVILSSRFCENDCLTLFPETAGKTHVMPFAVFMDEQHLKFTAFDSIRDKYSLPDRFLMVANLFAPTKNHKTLFEALGILKREGRVVPLVCTGNIVDYAKQEFANEILQQLTEYKIRDQVSLLGLIPRADQVALYRMAVALVQPSINEGWSTSVEEAKVLGKNLILSNIEVHLEQYPGNPYFFEALDARSLSDTIKKVWNGNQQTKFPEIERERAAFNAYQENVKEFGKRFLEIAALE